MRSIFIALNIQLGTYFYKGRCLDLNVELQTQYLQHQIIKIRHTWLPKSLDYTSFVLFYLTRLFF
jgi:hypothetical protein